MQMHTPINGTNAGSNLQQQQQQRCLTLVHILRRSKSHPSHETNETKIFADDFKSARLPHSLLKASFRLLNASFVGVAVY